MNTNNFYGTATVPLICILWKYEYLKGQFIFVAATENQVPVEFTVTCIEQEKIPPQVGHNINCRPSIVGKMFR